MCGIIAIFDREGSPLLAEAAVQELSSRMTTRGPDHSAVYCRPTFALGHERLSIMDPSPHAHQPLVGSALDVPALGDLAAVVNGEIYNFRSLLELPEVVALGSPAVTGSDSEVVLHLARAFGPDPAAWVPRLHGMFALVLVDEATGEYVAARDSVGIKPLYLGTTADGRVMFASELKAIHDNCESVQLFPPGHFYTKARGFVKFYEPRWDVDDAGGLPPVKDEEVRDGLIEAVRLRMMSDVPYGALLSGGLDSCITCRYVRGERGVLHWLVGGSRGGEGEPVEGWGRRLLSWHVCEWPCVCAAPRWCGLGILSGVRRLSRAERRVWELPEPPPIPFWSLVWAVIDGPSPVARLPDVLSCCVLVGLRVRTPPVS